jgi:rifampicin phosphotransferase
MQTQPRSSVVLLPLASPAADVHVAGGKGAGLSRLIRAGFPVPPGFVIPTSTYRAFVAANRLADELRTSDPQGIRQTFEAGEIPAEIAEAILAAYHDLCPSDAPGPVAVRSSATAEDLPGASFAGQQDTYLNIVGDTALLAAVRSCWASLWTDRAVAYRAHQAIDPAQVSMAVVVQRMVPADAAGVLFTVNPVTGNDQEIVIDAAWGLGEALVSGRVAPDNIVVDKQTGGIRQLTVGDKAVMTVPGPNRTMDIGVASNRRTQPVLTPAQTAELARLGQAIEAQMGSAQDVEWAMAAGRLVILQSRPVTTVAPAQRTVPGDDAWPTPDLNRVQPFDLWTHADMGERWPDPVTPLTWSFACAMTNPNTQYALRDMGGDGRDDIAWARRFYGRVYMNEGAVAELLSRAGFPTSLVDQSFGSGIPSRLRRDEPLKPARVVRRLPRILRAARQRRRNESAYTAFFLDIDRWVDEFRECDLDSASDRELWHALEAVWWPRIMRGMNLHADAGSQAMSMSALLDGLLQRWGAGPQVAGELVSGVTGLRSAEMAPALWTIADRLRQAGLRNIVLDNAPSVALTMLRETPAAAPALAMLTRFLREHGHRATIEAELLYPRWAEAPQQVIAALVGYLGETAVRDPRLAEADSRRHRAEVALALDAQLNPFQRWIVRGMVARTQLLVRLRDNGQHYLVKLIMPVRHLYAEFGVRWSARGWLAHAEDVFFLDASELEKVIVAGDPAVAGLDLATLVAGRRAAYEHWFGVSAPDVFDANGQPVLSEPEAGETATRLVGIPASGGRATGTARIAHSPQEAAQLRHGEILVARSTDPGWTPAFALASGLVLEVGGQLSHGAIVAREYGLPAVLNVRDAMSRIRDGQVITVDGTLGAVYLDDQR